MSIGRIYMHILQELDADLQSTDTRRALGPYTFAACPTSIPSPMSALNEANRLHFLHPDGNGVRILALGELSQCQSPSCILNPSPYPTDGGDTQCFSQLLVLGELMRRLEYDHGRSIRPCEFFHSITGVGASG
jgi:hypothetical protein